MNATTAEREVVDLSSAPSTAMTLSGILRHVELVEKVIGEVMKEGTHYGASFPGDTKKNLLKPGADKLCLAFQLSPAFDVLERQLPNDHREYRITCRLTTPQGRVMGEGVGSCSTMEKKYRYRSDKRVCPECGKEAIIKGKKEYGGGWLCFAKKDGCGAKWPDGAKAIEDQQVGQVENADIADVFNTILKMAKKRAYVDATITATAASDLFTQDLEDIGDSIQREEKKAAAAPAQAPVAAAAPAKEATQTAPPKAAVAASAAAASKSSTAKDQVTSDRQSTAGSAAAAPTTTPAARPDTMSMSAPKPDCQIWHSALAKLTDPKLALDVWQESCRSDQGGTWQVRFDTLKDMVLAIETIHQVLGEQKGREVVADIAREINHDVPGIQMIRKELIRASNGELATAQAPAGPTPDEDQPPF